MARCGAVNDALQRCGRTDGHDGDHRPRKARGTTSRNFRCDDERWADFLAACEAEGTDASKQIRDMIDIWLEGRE